MSLLSLRGACLAYGHVALLDHADLQLEPGERVALIGRNGTGKSSLLKVLAGTAMLDDGEFQRRSGLRLAQVEQEPDFEPGLTVFDALIAGLGEATRSLQRYHLVSQQLGEPDADHDVLLAELGRLQAELEAHGAWTISAQTERVISRFGLPADASVEELSGGQRKRLALARAFLLEPELLLLDEPTNHLDIESIEWLENLLVEEGPSLLFVTHDRRFLDRVATRIVELDRGRLASFPGRFASYLERKEQMLNAEALADQRFDKLLAQEEAWIRQGVEARRTRSAGRARRLDRLRVERAARRERLGKVRLRIDAGERSGRLVAELDRVSKSFPGPDGPRRVVSDFSARILRGDRVGLIGPNGAGKTTLLRLILGELPPDSGSVRLGTNVEVAYFDQFRAQLDPEATLLDAVAPGSEWIESGDRPRHVISYLGDFLFSPERARSPVRSLSGGERNRLLLARLFARPANVLVLDEPTNDLDIETLELLEELLDGYPGTVFLVSHDRAFLDNVVTQTIAAEGDGIWCEYAGGYEDWQRQRPQASEVTQPAASASTARREPPTRRPDTPPRLSYKETRELAALPGRIEALEAEQRQIAASFEDPALYSGSPEELRRLTGRMGAIEVELAELIERWEALELRNTK